FWASWCEPCGQAMPALDRIYRAYRNRGLVVIGVNVDRNVENARSFLQRTRVSFPIVHDSNQAFASQFSPPTMPSTYVIDRQGIVRHVHAGFRGAGDAQQLEQVIRGLL
ncbi:MAG TPA: TlpA disulfide reductase family protein, partial [Sandaracinaceae bacterium]